MKEQTTPIGEAPTGLTDRELANWAMQQFPNARGTLGMVLRRFHLFANNGGMSGNDCPTRYDSSSPTDGLSGCPHCGAAVNCVPVANHS